MLGFEIKGRKVVGTSFGQTSRPEEDIDGSRERESRLLLYLSSRIASAPRIVVLPPLTQLRGTSVTTSSSL